MKTPRPAMPSRRAINTNNDDEVMVVDVPNQQEIDSVARLLLQEHNRHDSWEATSQRCEALLDRLEALHDNPENEKAILFNKLHKPLEAFLQLAHIKNNEVSNLLGRGEKLLSIWEKSLRRTPAPQRFIPSTLTPGKTFCIPREISESPEREDTKCSSMDLDIDTNRRNSTTNTDQPLLAIQREDRLNTSINQPYKPINEVENARVCQLCDIRVALNPLATQQHIRSKHKEIMGKKSDVPKNPMEYCEEHSTWFVHKNRERHYKKPHQHSEQPLPRLAYVFDPTSLTRISGTRPIGKKSRYYGRGMSAARQPLLEFDKLSVVSDGESDFYGGTSPDHLSAQSASSTTSPATSDKNENLSPVGHYNLRGKKRRRSLTNSPERAASITSVNRVWEGSPPASTIVVARRPRSRSDAVKRTRLQSGARGFRTALKKCETNAEVQLLVAERVRSPFDDSKCVNLILDFQLTNVAEVVDAQFRSTVSVRQSQIESMVRERVGDDNFVADICDMPEHHNRVLYLEAKCELLTRRNVALEGERARYNALAQRAMYGEADGMPSGRQQALDQLVREHLGWRTG